MNLNTQNRFFFSALEIDGYGLVNTSNHMIYHLIADLYKFCKLESHSFFGQRIIFFCNKEIHSQFKWNG